MEGSTSTEVWQGETAAQQWAAAEVAGAALGDTRRRTRLASLLAAVVEQPTASLPQATGSWAGAKGAYRFLDNAAIRPEALLAAARPAVQQRVAQERTVLVVQDTTSLNFTPHPKTQGLGHLENGHCQGLLVHSALAVSGAGVPLGLRAQRVWARPPVPAGTRAHRRKRRYADKESVRWEQTEAASLADLATEGQVVTVADREGDIYEWFAAPRPAWAHLLVRASRERRLRGTRGSLWPTLRQQPAAGTLTVELGPRGSQPARRARWTGRWTQATLQPPRDRPVGSAPLPDLTLGAVLVLEHDAPSGVAPLGWQLLTDLPIETFAAAVQLVTWYTRRWVIERYHLVLKSGCQVERLQLETATRLQRALAVYCLAAWRLLWLTYHARQQPDASCEALLAVHEWQALYCTVHRTPLPPAQPPSLHQAVRWIAHLGGFLGRRHDGAPGVIVLWRGLRRLQDIAATWLLLHPAQDSG